MKRKLFFFTMASLLFSFMVFIPYWTGVEAEKQFRLFNQHYPSHDARLILKEATYQRGWLTSHAESSFEIANSRLAPELQHLVISHQIEHGFLPLFPTVIYSTIAPRSDMLHQLGLTESPLMVKTILQLDGSGSSEVHSHLVSLQAPDKQTTLQLQPIAGTANFTSNFTKLIGELQFPQLQVETEHGKVQIDNTKVTTNLQAYPDELWLGLSQCRIETVNLLSKTFPAVTLQQVNFSVDNQIVDGYLQVNWQTSMQQLAVKQEIYGPGNITVELRHLNVNSAHRLREILNDFEKLLTAPTNVVVLGKLMQQGVALLSAQPEVAIPQFNFTSSQGNLVGSAELGVDKVDATAWLYPRVILEAFHGNLSLSLPETLLNQFIAIIVEPATADKSADMEMEQTIRTLLASWIKQGLITQQGKTYHIQAKLQHGVLDLNGRQFALKNLL